MENGYYHDVTSFMKIGKIDPNVKHIMDQLEEAINWRDWSISTIWRCDSLFKCDALIRMLEERKKDIELNKLMDETIKANEHKNAPVLDEATKILIEEIQKQEEFEKSNELVKDEQTSEEMVEVD